MSNISRRTVQPRYAGLVLVCVLIASIAGYVRSASQPDEFTATSSLLFRDPGFDQKLFGSTYSAPNQDPTRQAQTNLALVTVRRVAQNTAAALGTPRATQSVVDHVEAKSDGDSDIVEVVATASAPAKAATLANTYAAQFIRFRRAADQGKVAQARALVDEQIRSLGATEREGSSVDVRGLRQRSEQLGVLSALQTGNVELAQAANVPSARSAPSPARDAVIAAVLGALIGIGTSVLWGRYDTRLRSAEEIGEAFSLPVLTSVSKRKLREKNDDDARAVSWRLEPEAFRILRNSLRYFALDTELRVVAVTSSQPGEGKSTVSANLAAAAAEASDDRVLLLEADLRRPALAERVGSQSTPGLTDLIAAGADEDRYAEFVQTVELLPEGGGATFDFVPAGSSAPNPTQQAGSARFAAFLSWAKANYDFIVIDTAPVMAVADTIPIVKQTDGVVIVAAVDRTTRGAGAAVLDRLRDISVEPVGLVVNFTPNRRNRYGAYAYSQY